MLVECKTKSKSIVQAYMDGVLSGDIVACKYVKLAVKRHLKDFETAQEKGFYFDPEAAQVTIDFFGLLKHSKGRWAGKPFKLEPWQMFIFWVVYGWKCVDGTRRFRTVYEEVARKNGKSTALAGVGLYGLGFDNEMGAEIYSVATKEEQARIIFGEGQRMATKSGNLGGMAKVHKKSISIDSTDSCWKPLGKDSKYQDGLNPHQILVDEFHAHPDRSMLDVMDSGVGARLQPLLFIVTTAGFSTQSACYLERDYATKVLEGVVEDDSYFAIIFTLDYDENGHLLDDWKDESVWIKANPNLGITVSLKDMQRLRNKAIESPVTMNNFLTKKLNIWTTQKVKWANITKWDECPCFWRGEIAPASVFKKRFGIDDDIKLAIKLKKDLEDFMTGKKCYGGLDLSSNTDIAAEGLLFPFEDGYYITLPRFYVPKENARARERKDKVSYETWGQQGFITLTEGNVVDYATIQADMFEDCENFDVDSIAFDRWNFEAIRQRLVAEGVPEDKLISFGQGFASMSAPMKELEKIILSGKLIHNNNPVLKWMITNVAAKTDPAGNIKPDKEKSNEKIDGIVTLIMALGLAITKPAEKVSVYETRGVLNLES